MDFFVTRPWDLLFMCSYKFCVNEYPLPPPNTLPTPVPLSL